MVITSAPVPTSFSVIPEMADMSDPMMDVCMSFPESNMGSSPTYFSSVCNNSTMAADTAAADECRTSPSNVLQLLWKANSFFMQGLRCSDGRSCLPLMVGDRQVGVLRHDVVSLLRSYPHVFTVTQNIVLLNPQLTSYESRTQAVGEVLADIRATGKTVALRSWRGENFVVWGQYGSERIMEVERAAVALLGIRAFGVHITGFVRDAEGGVRGVWLQKRADDKPTYPGMMDTMVGGGLTAGLTPSQVLYKEAAEEASVPSQLVDRATAVGTVSFFTETDRGLHANTEYVYEIELPENFEPQISDGEVQGFVFIEIKDILDYLLSPNYKLTSTPILIDFLIRHGIITSQTVADLPEITEMLHTPLSHLYRSWPTFTSLSDNISYPSPATTVLDTAPLPTTTCSSTSSSSRNSEEPQLASERGGEESDVREESEEDSDSV